MTRSRWTAVVLLVALLGGCGGGGGGGGSSGCPPTSVLTISPTAVHLTAGTAPVEFDGGVSDCTESLHWTLTGPGSLDHTTGVPVLYTPPASVPKVETASLTAAVGSLSKSATITIDPSAIVVSGRVIGIAGGPLAGATVRVGSGSVTTDSTGAFSISGVAPPYDAYASSPSGLLTSVYPGLRRLDPTLVVFDEELHETWLSSSGPLVSNVTGAVSGGAGFPEDAGHETGVTFKSADATSTGHVSVSSSTFLLPTWWSSPSTTVGALHALQWQVKSNGVPTSYDGYGTRTGVTLTDHTATSGQDVALSAVGTASLSGTVTPAGSYAPMSLFVHLADGARIRILPPPSDPSPFSATGADSFSIPTPTVSGATVDVVVRQDYPGWSFQEVHRHGLDPGATGVAVSLVGLPYQISPAGGAIAGAGAMFTWYAMLDHPVYVVSFRGPTGDPGFDVFTTVEHLTIPTDFPIPSSASYTWKVRGSSAFSTVDDAAGPGGFLAPAASYRIGQTDTWTFTTPP